jgi:uncharacterized MAPEG superfamily protein
VVLAPRELKPATSGIASPHAGANPGDSATLAVAFIAVRVLHDAMYLAEVPPARTGFFALGLACSVGPFVLAALAG